VSATETETKNVGKKLNSKNVCSEVSVNSPRGIRGVSPEEEREGYSGKVLQKRKALSEE